MFRKFIALAAIAAIFPVHAAVVEVGDLNIIDDFGNASDGLRFLDMTYSDGLSQAAALLNAQSTYSNARLATASEFDDLYAAAGILYNASSMASDAFTVGNVEIISSGTNYDGGALSQALGYTNGTATFIWTDPDGDGSLTSTRDYLSLTTNDTSIFQATGTPPSSALGWMLVSAAPVPVPAAGWLFMSALLGFAGKKRLSRR